MTARFPRKTFRAEDPTTGAWFEADAVLCAVTGRLGYERFRSGAPPTPDAGATIRRLKNDVDYQAARWARRICGPRARPWHGDDWGRMGRVA